MAIFFAPKLMPLYAAAIGGGAAVGMTAGPKIVPSLGGDENPSGRELGGILTTVGSVTAATFGTSALLRNDRFGLSHNIVPMRVGLTVGLAAMSASLIACAQDDH